MFRRVRWSLVRWNLLVFGLILAVAGTLLYAGLVQITEAQIDGLVEAPVDQSLLDQASLGSTPKLAKSGSLRFYLVADLEGNVLIDPMATGLTRLPGLKDSSGDQLRAELSGKGRPLVDAEIWGQPYRLSFRPIAWLPDAQAGRKLGTQNAELTVDGVSLGPLAREPANPQDQTLVLVSALGVASYQATLRSYLLTLLASGAFAFGLALLGAWFLAGRALVPIERAYNRQQEFVADAAHELRTPLTVLQASADLLNQHRSAPLEANVELLDDLRQELARMTKLAEDLLCLARSDLGQLELAVGETDLGDLAGKVARRVIPLAMARGVRLRCEAPSPVLAEVDPDRIQQVLLILLDNALRHSASGGEVVVRVGRRGAEAALEVADTGEGMSEEALARVFDRFYRVDPARSRAEGRAGLGLAIAKALVETHGGRIAMASEPGRGTAVVVFLPVSQSPAATGRLRRLLDRVRRPAVPG